MEVIDKNTFKIGENETICQILCNYLLKEEETEFCAYQRTHFLEEENIYSIFKLYTKEGEPKKLIEKVFHKLENIFESLENSL